MSAQPSDLNTNTAVLPKKSSQPLLGVGLNPEQIKGYLHQLVSSHILLQEEWDEISEATEAEIYHLSTRQSLLDKLVSLHLLSRYQADKLMAGRAHDLILGHYRILGVLGRGGMGVVYRGENIFLRREVAIKTFACDQSPNPNLLRRFYAEARSAARLQHPNLVPCIDAGQHRSRQLDSPARDYYVMELVNGKDIESTVRHSGPLPVHKTCDLFRQVAEALAEAHRHGLVHRDIKPGNILITADWQAKVVDFGLALHPFGRITHHGALLGTIGFMAPEQARNPQAVDQRADLFSLGATMYYALSGKQPFPESGNPIEDITKRFVLQPVPIKQLSPSLPDALVTLIQQMMSQDPAHRPANARVVAMTLAGLSRFTSSAIAVKCNSDGTARKAARIVVVANDEHLGREVQKAVGSECGIAEARTVDSTLDYLDSHQSDLVIIELPLVNEDACELIQWIRHREYRSQPQILLISKALPPESMAGLIAVGADDFLVKPFSKNELLSRIFALQNRKKQLLAKAESLCHSRVASQGNIVTSANESFEASGYAQHAVQLLKTVLAQVSGECLGTDLAYSARLNGYIRAIAESVVVEGEYEQLKDPDYLATLSIAASMHDIGMIAISHCILGKPMALDHQERMVMQTHTMIGSDWLTNAEERHPELSGPLQLAAKVARSHHEFWDGTGYPDQLEGKDIPLAGRMTSLITVYDALRSRRPYRPGLSHARTVRMISQECAGQFDPVLLKAFLMSSSAFEMTFNKTLSHAKVN